MKSFGFCLASLYIAAILQVGLAPYVAIFGVRPDFILACAASLGMCLPRGGASAAGFGAGLLTGALAGANLAHYVISRAFASFTASWARSFRFESTPWAVGLTVSGCCVLGGLVFLMTAAPRGIGGYLGDTITSALYNGVLAIPMYALFRRVLNPTVR